MDMIVWLESFLETDDTKIIYVLTLILIFNLLDFLMGWVNARFNKDVKFSSSKAVFGIIRKVTILILLIVFIPFALLFDVGLTALYVLYTGYLLSELSSIGGHLGIFEDNKEENIFRDFIETIIRK